MKFVVMLLALYGFLESCSYGIYEYRQRENKTGGITIFVISTLRFCFTNFQCLTLETKYIYAVHNKYNNYELLLYFLITVSIIMKKPLVINL